MLNLSDKKHLDWEKREFFKNYLSFINQNLSFKIKTYVHNFLNYKNQKDFYLNEDELHELEKASCDKNLLYAIIYVCFRTMDFRWLEFFDRIIKSELVIDKEFSTSLNYTARENDYLLPIRQCRPDGKKYTYNFLKNVGFYNKNSNINYRCYNDSEAKDYILSHLGVDGAKAYDAINSAQGKSDFFLVSSLYIEGGLSVDVCSVVQADINIILRNYDFILVYDDSNLHKKFLYAPKQNNFFKYYLLNLMNKAMKRLSDDYNNFTGRKAFTEDFLDFYSFRHKEFKGIKIGLLDDKIFSAFVEANISEESLLDYTNFPRSAAKGLFKKNLLLSIDNRNVFSKPEFYMPSSNNVLIVGEDKNKGLTEKVRKPYSVSSLDVWQVDDIDLSGSGCLWKDGEFIDLESYLSTVSYSEAKDGFWKKPDETNITRYIDSDCIIAYSPGNGCFGHYIVDDIPRLGLIKEYLGADFYNKTIIIPNTTPQWGKDLLKYFLGIEDKNFLIFDCKNEIWKLRKAYLASYPHRVYCFHNYIKEFYTLYSKAKEIPFRKVCLSRKTWEKTKVHQRIFQSQNLFEDIASKKGYEIIRPELLSIDEQVKLMSETACQIGEHGSAQHASVYNGFGHMVVGTISPLTEVQCNLGRIYNDLNIICYANEHYYDENHNLYYDIDRNVINNFFDVVEHALQLI